MKFLFLKCEFLKVLSWLLNNNKKKKWLLIEACFNGNAFRNQRKKRIHFQKIVHLRRWLEKRQTFDLPTLITVFTFIFDAKKCYYLSLKKVLSYLLYATHTCVPALLVFMFLLSANISISGNENKQLFILSLMENY